MQDIHNNYTYLQSKMSLQSTFKNCDNMTFICSSCKIEFKTENDYEFHVETNHNDLMSDDKRALKLTSELSAALDAVFKELPEVMDIKENTEEEEEPAKLHIEEKPTPEPKAKSSVDIKENISEFNCDQCSFKAESNRDIRMHKKNSHDDLSNMTCSFCPMKFQSKDVFRYHIQKKHGKEIKCHKCEFRSTLKTIMRAHRLKHNKETLKYNCDECKEEFKTKILLVFHKKTHLATFRCDKCEYKEASRKALNIHIKKTHIQDNTPIRGTKRLSDKQSPDTIQFKIETQKKTEEPVKQLKKKLKHDANKKKLPMKESEVIGGAGWSLKQSEKSVTKNEPTEKVSNKYIKYPKTESNFCREFCQSVESKYSKMFELVGLNIDDFMTFPATPDGLCGAYCVSLHLHLDDSRQAALDIRRDINKTKVTFWDEHYKKDYLFDDEGNGDKENPHEEIVAMTAVKFPHVKKYLDLLRHEDGGKMWITQSDLQIVADIYQKTVYTLETEVPKGRMRAEAKDLEREGMKVGARWTVQEPNPDMAHVRGYHEGTLNEVGDIYLINRRLNHFDLLVHKDSMLARKGNVKFMELHPHVSLHSPSRGEKVRGEMVPEKKQVNKFKCMFCDNLTETEAALNIHKETEHTVQTLQDMKIEIINLRKLQKNHPQLQPNPPQLQPVTALLPQHNFQPQPQSTQAKPQPTPRPLSVLKCENCANTFTTKPMLDAHIKNKHIQMVTKTNFRFSSIDSCDKCGKVFNTKTLLEAHIKNTHNLKRDESYPVENVFRFSKVIKCDECSEECATQNQMKQHVHRDHPSKEISPMETEEQIEKTKETNFICKVCKVERNTFEKLGKHIANHTEDGDWYCEICDFQSNTLEALEFHMREKNHIFDILQTKEINCNFCEKIFPSKTDMANHRRSTHRTFKPCRNPVGCVFKEECFYNHQPIPNGMSRCFQCGNEFDSITNMMMHRKSNHEGVKICKNFVNDRCQRGKGCWWIHDTEEIHQQDFQQNHVNLVPPIQSLFKPMPPIQRPHQQIQNQKFTNNTKSQEKQTMTQMLKMMEDNMRMMKNMWNLINLNPQQI